jgi:DNA polymerase
MHVRDKLRLFLEQRREAGETELVLDRMTVEEVLRIVGAPPAADTTAPSGSVDWRAMLRAGERATAEASEVARVAPPAEPPSPGRPEPAGHEVGTAAGPVDSPVLPSGPVSLDAIPAGLSVGTMGRELFGGSGSELGSLDALAAAVRDCTKCALSRTAKHPVPGEGNPRASLVCVGEAPGAVEDETGRPFVGPAGQLLDRILGAIGLSRKDVFICNVLKHRPPGNRNPLPDEVQACSPYLVRQIELIRPAVIIAFGTFAAQTLLDTKDAISRLRGRIHRYYGVPLIVTYHPAALLRNPGWKKPTWEDVQLAQRLLDRALGS